MTKELEKPEVFSRACDDIHWFEVIAYGKCHQCKMGYENEAKKVLNDTVEHIDEYLELGAQIMRDIRKK